MTAPAEESLTPPEHEGHAGPQASNARSRSRIWIPIVLFLTCLGAGLIWSGWLFPSQSAQELLEQAYRAQRAGDHQRAEQLARRAVELNTTLDDARLLAARMAVSRSADEQALQDLSQITDQQSDDWLAARQLAAEILHNHLYRFREAEKAYRDLLAIQPDHVIANEGYARLLGLCGRRRDAIPQVLHLIRSGEDTDLLILISRESGALSDPDMLAAARKADPTDPNPLLGLAQVADSAQDPAAALQFLQQAATLEGLPADFHGRLGRQLLANERFDELERWRAELPSRPDYSFDTWIVLGELAERAEDPRGAIRCYWEAVRRHPESLQAMNQLAQKLISQNQPELAEPFLIRVKQMNELRQRQQIVILSNKPPEYDDVVEMVKAYRSVGRLWEALAWGRLALAMKPERAEVLQIVADLNSQLPRLSLEMTSSEFNPADQVDLAHYPLPSRTLPSTIESSAAASGKISFRQQSQDVGFDFQYFDGTPGTTYRMFEFSGGGIAVLDYDNDGAPDLFCTQGREWDMPLSERSLYFDRLFRNQQGQSFRDISRYAGMPSETGFGQGVSAGDVNNDGFADLYVANTGTNTLWLNNGDGTFTDHSAALVDQTGRWTTSCLIADLNGDSVPDLYDVNYLSGEDVFDRVCEHDQGGPDLCAPQDFAPAMDRVWLGDGEGGFLDRTTEFLSPPPNGKGLGIAAMNMGDGRLSLFVANDTTANFFYTADSPNATSLTETALVSGLAFSGEGRAQGCMGIAVGDCTQDGRLDLLVTNFLYESNTLYCPIGEGLYQDRTREVDLHSSSLSVLGFGTQFLDANGDGRLELFVANGHTHDQSKHDTPYAMVPQVFEWTGKRFAQLDKSQLGPWSGSKMVGRAAARLDWNLDHKPDLAVGLLDSSSFLLTNTSATADNRFVTLKLVATGSARDAIGTAVTAFIGDSNRVHQLTAGDGYQCSNERTLQIGCGPAAHIDRLQVLWPSGEMQVFNNIPTSQSFVLVEGGELFTRE